MRSNTHHYTREQLLNMAKWAHRGDKCLQVLPPVTAIIMIIHDLFLCLGIRWQWTEAIVIAAAIAMMCIFSYALGYCPLHRCFILYNWLMLICIHFERTVGFDNLLQPMHYIMLILGILLLFKLANKHFKMK